MNKIDIINAKIDGLESMLNTDYYTTSDNRAILKKLDNLYLQREIEKQKLNGSLLDIQRTKTKTIIGLLMIILGIIIALITIYS